MLCTAMNHTSHPIVVCTPALRLKALHSDKRHCQFEEQVNNFLRSLLKNMSAGFAEADKTSVVEESPYRATPLCQHYDECGGCSQQHLSYDYQLQAKNSRVSGLIT